MESAKPSDLGPRSKPAPGLYLVATPIGNVEDITLRALRVLSAADVVACEDTRMTGKLMMLLGIRAPLTPYHEHNAERARPALLARLARGEVVALVPDAGTPMISDPGWRLAREAAAAGVMVTALPGASAPVTALQLSGLPADRFLFAGFPPPRSSARRTLFEELKPIPATLVLFESPRRLAASLADLAAVLGPRQAAVARELTKLHEEVRRAPLAELAAHYAGAGPPRGEVVVVIGPPPAQAAPDAADVDALLRAALRRGDGVRGAAAAVAAATGLPRRAVYARALELARDGAERQ